MTRIDTVHRAIRHIYEAALAPGQWSGAVTAVAQAIGGHKAILSAQGSGTPGLAVMSGGELPPPWIQREVEHGLIRWTHACPIGKPLREHALMADPAFRQSALYTDIIGPAGGFHGIAAPLLRLPDHQVVFAAGRESCAVDFSPKDVNAARRIVPHLAAAVQVQSRLDLADRRARDAYEVIARLDFGVILLDARMRPIFANPRAERLARDGDGLILTRHHVSAVSAGDARALQDAIAAAVGVNGRGAGVDGVAAVPLAPMRRAVTRRPPLAPLVVRILPVDASDVPDGISTATRVILFLMEPDRPPGIDPVLLATTFRFTRREAALAILLARGMDLAEAATELGIAKGTARSYLKQVLAKTYTHRQAEMVSVVLRVGMEVSR
ncbi:helix-turn-helix transcriptional regulator [Pigmentiphaga litoralis]|uniref:helix-turn-helix transcriptional regulator n=1 Tax=Pigmentiphaga litoralis TaxID=516702 RepID=UPI003B42F3FB